MKIWKWIISFKIRRVDTDERIGYLANELIKQVKASGRTIAKPDIDKGYGSLDINIHWLGTSNAVMYVGDIANKWEVKTKPTFKEF